MTRLLLPPSAIAGAVMTMPAPSPSSKSSPARWSGARRRMAAAPVVSAPCWKPTKTAPRRPGPFPTTTTPIRPPPQPSSPPAPGIRFGSRRAGHSCPPRTSSPAGTCAWWMPDPIIHHPRWLDAPLGDNPLRWHADCTALIRRRCRATSPPAPGGPNRRCCPTGPAWAGCRTRRPPPLRWQVLCSA